MFGGDVNPTTIQRAIVRGELPATKGPHPQSRYHVSHADLMAWAAERGMTVLNGVDERVNPETGEVVAELTPAERAMAARQRLAGLRKPEAPSETPAAYESAQLGPVEIVDGEVVPVPAPAVPVDSNVARVLPSLHGASGARRPGGGTPAVGRGAVRSPSVNVASDRLALLSKLVRGGHIEAAQLVLEAWES